MQEITADLLRRLCPHAHPRIVNGIVEHQAVLGLAEIDTPLRLCHFLAQIAVESDHLKVTREYASGAAYEGRRDLGNTQPGDGRRYRGRGLIQTTGRANYREATAEIRKTHPDCPDFEAEPEKLEEFPWALLGGVIYWHKRGINRHADRDDVLAVTKAVNGGTNGLAERTAYLAKAKMIWSDTRPTPDVSAPAPPRRVIDHDLLADSIRVLQRQVGAVPDGVFGPETAAKIAVAQRGG